MVCGHRSLRPLTVETHQYLQVLLLVSTSVWKRLNVLVLAACLLDARRLGITLIAESRACLPMAGQSLGVVRALIPGHRYRLPARTRQ